MKKRFQLQETALRSARATNAGTATATDPGMDALDAVVSVADLQRVEVLAAGLPRLVEEAG
jgi:hypothetical protein